jgi:hypothetical protein
MALFLSGCYLQGARTPKALFGPLSYRRARRRTRRRVRARALTRVRTATRTFDLQLAIATLRLPTHRLGKRESDQSRAKQHETRNGHNEKTVRSKLLTHGAPPNRAPRALLEGNNCPVARSKELPSDSPISIQADVLVQHLFRNEWVLWVPIKPHIWQTMTSQGSP